MGSISWQAKWKSCRSEHCEILCRLAVEWQIGESHLESCAILGTRMLKQSKTVGWRQVREREAVAGDKYLTASFKAIRCSLVSESAEGALLQ